MHLKRGKIFSTLVIMTLIIAVVTNVFFIGPIVTIVRAADESDSYYNDTTLNVTVLQLHPRISWYDLQNAGGTSFLNAQLDVNVEYYFMVNISSDQKWENIKYVNISCWHDLGSDASTYNYNGTLGGNINMKLQYDNVSDTTGVFSMLWPTTGSEAALGSCSEVNVTDSDPEGSPGYTETYNLTFAWTPAYQFRYAPDPSNTADGFNDLWSWNFNITVVDDDGYYSYNNPTKGPAENETGVYSYTSITSAGWPVVVGNPGVNTSVTMGGSNNITIVTVSNGNYSLAVNVTNLTHKQTGSNWILNTSIWTRGGMDDFSTFFDGTNPLYYYGSGSIYNASEGNITSKTTDDVEWGVDIPLAQLPGDYNGTIYYRLRTQTG